MNCSWGVIQRQSRSDFEIVPDNWICRSPTNGELGVFMPSIEESLGPTLTLIKMGKKDPVVKSTYKKHRAKAFVRNATLDECRDKVSTMGELLLTDDEPPLESFIHSVEDSAQNQRMFGFSSKTTPTTGFRHSVASSVDQPMSGASPARKTPRSSFQVESVQANSSLHFEASSLSAPRTFPLSQTPPSSRTMAPNRTFPGARILPPNQTTTVKQLSASTPLPEEITKALIEQLARLESKLEAITRDQRKILAFLEHGGFDVEDVLKIVPAKDADSLNATIATLRNAGISGLRGFLRHNGIKTVAKLMEMVLDTTFATEFTLSKKRNSQTNKQMAFDEFGLVDVLS
ncbi:unnamed protein product, partial [Cyprideis torosa]